MPRIGSATRRIATAVVAVSLGASALAGCSDSSGDNENSALTVGFVVDPSWAQVPVAEAAGYFESEGVDVEVVNFSTGVQALQALEAGQIDVTTAADVPVAAALTSSTNMTVVADGSRWDGSVVVASAKAGISTSADLTGKKIGTPLGTSAAYFADSFLEQSAVDATLVQADPSSMVTAMQQGDLDAVSIFQPYQQQVISALGSDAVVLDPQRGTYVQQSLYLASEDATENKASALSGFFDALDKASGDLTDQTSAAVSAVSEATQLPSDLVEEILTEFDFTIELPAELSEGLSDLGEWAKEQGNLDSDAELPNYSSFLDSSFLPKS